MTSRLSRCSAPGTALSVVLVNPSLQTNPVADIFTFDDDTASVPTKAKLRFVNVSEADQIILPDDAGDNGDNGDNGTGDDGGDNGIDAGGILEGASFGLGGGAFYTEYFSNVTTAQGISPTGANVYVQVAPGTGIDSTLTDLPTAAVTIGGTLNLTAASTVTAFYAMAADSPTLVWCYDGQASPKNAALTNCSADEQPERQFGHSLRQTGSDARRPARLRRMRKVSRLWIVLRPPSSRRPQRPWAASQWTR